MTLTLDLTPAIEVRLRERARVQGLSADECALRLLEAGLQPADRSAVAIALLQSWIDRGDEAEQRETGEYLVKSLDEDRSSYRKLYPPELKGVTW